MPGDLVGSGSFVSKTPTRFVLGFDSGRVANLLPKSRTVPGSVDAIRHALDWAGLDYDYGPFNGGPHAPYYQSKRLDLYMLHATKLLERNQAYRCFCSPAQLSFKREALARTGSNKTYDKTCLRLSEEEVVRKVKAGEKFVIRLNVSGLHHSDYPDTKSHCQLGLEATSITTNKRYDLRTT
jgi:glutamyl/glutaminyl-tRNA synthetase